MSYFLFLSSMYHFTPSANHIFLLSFLGFPLLPPRSSIFFARSGYFTSLSRYLTLSLPKLLSSPLSLIYIHVTHNCIRSSPHSLVLFRLLLHIPVSPHWLRVFRFIVNCLAYSPQLFAPLSLRSILSLASHTPLPTHTHVHPLFFTPLVFSIFSFSLFSFFLFWGFFIASFFLSLAFL